MKRIWQWWRRFCHLRKVFHAAVKLDHSLLTTNWHLLWTNKTNITVKRRLSGTIFRNSKHLNPTRKIDSFLRCTRHAYIFWGLIIVGASWIRQSSQPEMLLTYWFTLKLFMACVGQRQKGYQLGNYIHYLGYF